jgi:hypothetical protein
MAPPDRTESREPPLPNRRLQPVAPGLPPVSALVILAALLSGCSLLPHAALTVADMVRGEADAWTEAKEDIFGEKKDMSGRSYIARQIGRGISDGDARLLAAAAAKALEDGTTGRPSYWRSPTSDARATLRPGVSAKEWRALASTPEAGVARAPLAEILGRPARAVRAAQYRIGPGLEHDAAGGLRPGETFVAIARAADTNWILIGRGGKAVGYLHLSAMGPVEGTDAFVSLREPTRLPGGAGAMAAPLSAPSQCRGLYYEISVGGRRARKYRLRACRADLGGWQIAVPQVAQPPADPPPQAADSKPAQTVDAAPKPGTLAAPQQAQSGMPGDAMPRPMGKTEPGGATGAMDSTDAAADPQDNPM